MKWLKEILGDELFAQVEEKVNAAGGIELVNAADGAYIAKEQYDADIAAAKESADGSQNNEELATLRKDKEKLEGDIKKIKFDSALELKLATSGAKNAKALKGLIDMDKLTFDDEGLKGFDEQLEAIKADNDYLFATEPMAGGMPQGDSEPKRDGVEKAFIEKNPDLKID